MSNDTLNRIFAFVVMLSITFGIGFYLHSFWAGLASFGITALVMNRWE